VRPPAEGQVLLVNLEARNRELMERALKRVTDVLAE